MPFQAGHFGKDLLLSGLMSVNAILDVGIQREEPLFNRIIEAFGCVLNGVEFFFRAERSSS
jgi:hypothetical protein